MRLSSIERQEQIRKEALRIIHYKGYSNLSIRELAKNVGISEAAIYRHFESKDAITLALLEDLKDQFQVLVQGIGNIESPREMLYQFILRMIHFLENNHEMTALLFNEEVFPPDSPAAHSLQNLIVERQEFFQSLITRAQQQGEFRRDVPAPDLALILVGLIHKMVAEWRRLGFRFDMPGRVQEMLKTVDQLFS